MGGTPRRKFLIFRSLLLAAQTHILKMRDRPLNGRLGEHHAGELRQESAEAMAERIVPEELKRWGWKEKHLPARRQSDPKKRAMAAR